MKMAFRRTRIKNKAFYYLYEEIPAHNIKMGFRTNLKR